MGDSVLVKEGGGGGHGGCGHQAEVKCGLGMALGVYLEGSGQTGSLGETMWATIPSVGKGVGNCVGWGVLRQTTPHAYIIGAYVIGARHAWLSNHNYTTQY